MVSMKGVNWGMIGCGDVTEIKSGPGLYKSKNSKLVGVFNRSQARAIDYVKRHNIEKIYKTADELFNDENINIVYIATPPKFHKEYAIMCLNSGKIPYIEKPVANTYDECLEIKALAEELDIPVYIAFYRRGMEKFLKIKELLDRNEIGNIRYINVIQNMKVKDDELDRKQLPWRVIPHISGGGKFLDMAVHILDCLALYFGEMESMTGIVENKGGYYDAEDTVVATFKYKNGIVGSGTWCYVADKEVNKVIIVGDKGRIEYDGLSGENFSLIKKGLEKIYEFEKQKHVAMPYQQAIVNELIGKKKSFANFYEAINIVKMTEILLKNYYGN